MNKNPLETALDRLTRKDKARLHALNIPQQRRSEWKRGLRLPTSAQAQTLAIVARLSKDETAELQKWIATCRATAAQRELIAHP